MNKKAYIKFFPWVLVAYEIAIYLSMDAYAPALPKISHVFGITTNLAQFTATIWMLGGLLVQLIFGPLSDRYGRRPVLLLGGILYIVSSVVCATSPNIQWFLIARFFQGMAMPSMFIAGYAAINELYETEESIHILATMNSVTILAPAFGPFIGGGMLLFISWRWIFAALAVLAAVTVSGLYFIMPETVSIEQRSQKIKISNVVKQYVSIFRHIKFVSLALATFLPIVGLVAWGLAGPFIVTRMFHYSTLDFGIIQIFVFASFIVGTHIVKRFATEHRNQRLVNIGLGIILCGAILTVIVGYFFTASLFPMIAAIMISTFGCGITIPILSRLTLESSKENMGVKVSAFSVLRKGSGALAAGSLSVFYSNSLLSLAMIILTFTLIGIGLRYVSMLQDKAVSR